MSNRDNLLITGKVRHYSCIYTNICVLTYHCRQVSSQFQQDRLQMWSCHIHISLHSYLVSVPLHSWSPVQHTHRTSYTSRNVWVINLMPALPELTSWVSQLIHFLVHVSQVPLLKQSFLCRQFIRVRQTHCTDPNTTNCGSWILSHIVKKKHLRALS